MLQMDPDDRPTIVECLNNKCFDKIRNKSLEEASKNKITLPVTKNVKLSAIQKLLVKELKMELKEAF